MFNHIVHITVMIRVLEAYQYQRGLVVGHVDGGVPLQHADVALQLPHGVLQALLAVLLGDGVGDHGQPLVLPVQVLPVLLQALRCSGETQSSTNHSIVYI